MINVAARMKHAPMFWSWPAYFAHGSWSCSGSRCRVEITEPKIRSMDCSRFCVRMASWRWLRTGIVAHAAREARLPEKVRTTVVASAGSKRRKTFSTRYDRGAMSSAQSPCNRHEMKPDHATQMEASLQ